MKIFLFILAYIVMGIAEVFLNAFVYWLDTVDSYSYIDAVVDVLLSDTYSEPNVFTIICLWPFYLIVSICKLIVIVAEYGILKFAELIARWFK